VCDLETSRIGAPYIYIYDVSNLRFNCCVRQLQINFSLDVASVLCNEYQ
jgi:hypothetical protein